MSVNLGAVGIWSVNAQMRYLRKRKMTLLLVIIAWLYFFSMIQKLSIEVVELDPSISDIAKSWFQLKEDERMKVIIQDGLEYIRSKGWLLLFVI